MVIRLQALRYGQMVALFGSPSACKQWGNTVELGSVGNMDKINYPIAFTSKVFYVGLSDFDGYNFFGTQRSSSTLTYFVVRGRDRVVAYWLAIGV